MKLWKGVFLLIILGSLCLVCFGAQTAAEQKAISGKLIRLHVIANSDTAADQSVKLQVRDAVLALLGSYEWDSKEEAATWLRENLNEIDRVCLARLEELGCNASATVALENENYPTRRYDTFSLPAGEYLSLKITLGDGAGKNWWCVVYPSICLAAAGEVEATAACAGFTDREVFLITEDSGGVEIKFKLLEIIENFRKK